MFILTTQLNTTGYKKENRLGVRSLLTFICVTTCRTYDAILVIGATSRIIYVYDAPRKC